MARILIDGRFIGVGESMTRYIEEIIHRILAWDKENKYTLLVRSSGVKAVEEWFSRWAKEPEKSGGLDFEIKVLNIPHYSLAEQTKLLDFLNTEKYDLVHFVQFNHPIRYKQPFIVTIHDLTLFNQSIYHHPPLKTIAFNAVMKSAVFDSKKIITVSWTSKKEIVKRYRIAPEKIKIIYNGIDRDCYNPKLKNKKLKIRQFKQKYQIAGEYLLYTGAWKKHKNLLRMLQAFEQVNLKPRPQLVLVGKIDASEQEIIDEIRKINYKALKQGSNKLVIAAGYIEEMALPIVYAGAMAYIMPSLSEGFGLPPLEALACGTPVISSDLSSMPEILGRAPLYFNPYKIPEITAAIEKVVSDKASREEIIARGLQQVVKYSWDEAAARTLKLYKSLV